MFIVSLFITLILSTLTYVKISAAATTCPCIPTLCAISDAFNFQNVGISISSQIPAISFHCFSSYWRYFKALQFCLITSPCHNYSVAITRAALVALLTFTPHPIRLLLHSVLNVVVFTNGELIVGSRLDQLMMAVTCFWSLFSLLVVTRRLQKIERRRANAPQRDARGRFL